MTRKKCVRYVWRVEGNEGWGPYSMKGRKATDFPVWADVPHTYETGRPHPDEDLSPAGFAAFYDSGKPYKFGFKDLDQLRQWFSKGELKRLGVLGYKVKKYRAKKIYYGKKQVIYLK